VKSILFQRISANRSYQRIRSKQIIFASDFILHCAITDRKGRLFCTQKWRGGWRRTVGPQLFRLLGRQHEPEELRITNRWHRTQVESVGLRHGGR
jgi:hypothetical protein